MSEALRDRVKELQVFKDSYTALSVRLRERESVCVCRRRARRGRERKKEIENAVVGRWAGGRCYASRHRFNEGD